MRYCCKLGPFNFGVLAYADDIICISPTSRGLQIMVNELARELEILNQKANNDKSKAMVFENGSNVTDFKLLLGNRRLETVQHFTYLGIILKRDLRNDSDIVRCSKSFLKQFNAIYRKFYYVNLGGKLFLFKAYCMSFYGCDTWWSTHGCSVRLKEPAISYHKAIKRLHGAPYRTSNHM